MLVGTLDFETYSEAGFVWADKWRPIPESTGKPGLPAIGIAAYAEHSSTEILCAAYNIGVERLWAPMLPPPCDLFDFIAAGGLLESVNSYFEFKLWQKVAHERLGWPPLPLEQTRDTSGKARAHGLPGGLELMAKAIGASVQKGGDGKRLIRKFSIPKQPSKKDPRRRALLSCDPVDEGLLYSYCMTDIRAEAAASSLIPELSPLELEIWKTDQAINERGVQIDLVALDNCLEIVRQADEKYTRELIELTSGAVKSHGQIAELGKWLAANGLALPNMQAPTVEAASKLPNLPPACRRVLEIRLALNSASVKKLKAMKRRVSSDGRLRNLYNYCGAARTGRASGEGVQPQNLKSDGSDSVDDWDIEALEAALVAISYRSLEYLEATYGDPLNTVGGCIRGLFTAAPGYNLIASDYSAIEGVVLAALAGEAWRLDVFRTHGKIYESTASKISGIPFDEIVGYPEKHGGLAHPLRKPLGKIAELGSQYGGWINAWKNFGAGKYFDTDDEIKQAVLKWRKGSPNIVEYWGDQYRRLGDTWDFVPELYGVEGAVVKAIRDKGTRYHCRTVSFIYFGDVLYCRLPSGRDLAYHSPRLFPTTHRLAKQPAYKITYMGHNTDSTKGPIGWIRLESWGSKFVENITQAVARDIFMLALLRLERRGFRPVMHSHDEPVCETNKSVEALEAVMLERAPWFADWPIRVGGGWTGKRYRKG